MFGEGGVQGLDGEQHQHRKGMFMHFMNNESVDVIESHFTRNWETALDEWINQDHIVLFHEAEKVLLKTACAWTGVPLTEDEAGKRAGQLSAMIDASGGTGWRHYKGRLARSEAENWLSTVVVEARQGIKPVPSDSILHHIVYHTGLTGNLLPSRIAAVEIINLLRPIVAVARYLVYLAHALHENQVFTEPLKTEKKLNHCFVQEVRRHYPFFPFVAAKTVKSFDWHGVRFKKNTRVLLDLYSTNHDGKLWPEPNKFDPYRFREQSVNSFNLIPQGGGDFHKNHRCAGEWITIRLMEKGLDLLINKMKYNVPPQDLTISLSRIPAIPKSRFIMSGVGKK